MFRRTMLFAVFSLFAPPGSVRADERCYLLMFGGQTRPSLIRYTHSFATFVRVPEQGCPEVLTVSWMPASLHLHPLKLRAEEGVDVDLHTTIHVMLRNGANLSMWGPYEICPKLFEKARELDGYLESGEAKYHVINRFRRPRVLDCMHAMSDVDRDPGTFHTRTAYGAIATYYVLHHYGPWIVHPAVTHDWLIEHLGLSCYPLRRRDYCERPRSIFPILEPYYADTEPLLRRYRREE